MRGRIGELVVRALSVLLTLFTLLEVNYPRLSPQSQLAVFALFGFMLCFLIYPTSERFTKGLISECFDVMLTLTAVLCCGYVIVQIEPMFEWLWLDGRPLGDRAGSVVPMDIFVGVIGVLLVVEAARRTVGVALPILAGIFLLYAYYGPMLPGWLFPHRGYSVDRIVAQTFLHSQGVFGTALKVMFTYVFLFVVFGAFLEITGVTKFVIDYAKRLFGGTAGGPAKVSVLASGLMGSLSGSAVANAATTGTFTIPMMRSAGFQRHVAAGMEAAASSGGALVPPVMGAGAYMMLEIIYPPVTYLEIIKAAIFPAMLYYLSLFLIVHFYAKRMGTLDIDLGSNNEKAGFRYEGVVFLGALGALVVFLVMGYTPFRAVTLSLGMILLLGVFNPRTRITLAGLLSVMVRSARSGIALIAASACVGIVIGVVTLTGIGTKLPSLIVPLAEESLFLALILIMVSAIILGMGLPSAICYLLMATLIGPVLGNLGVIPLAAHLFIFYFGMMSMVTPPVALAAYTTASIAGAGIMRSGLAAFRFSLVGFVLPYMFVFRPELLLLSPTGEAPHMMTVLYAVSMAIFGIVALAAGTVGYLIGPLSVLLRGMLLLASGCLLYSGDVFTFNQISWVGSRGFSILDLIGVATLLMVFRAQLRSRGSS